MIFESKLDPGCIFLPKMFGRTLAWPFALNIRGAVVSDMSRKLHMHLHFVILVVAALSTPAIFAQDKNQPTVDELVGKNIEAKGGATTMKNLQTLRTTGKLLVPGTRADRTWIRTNKEAARRSAHRGFAPGHDADRGV